MANYTVTSPISGTIIEKAMPRWRRGQIRRYTCVNGATELSEMVIIVTSVRDGPPDCGAEGADRQPMPCRGELWGTVTRAPLKGNFNGVPPPTRCGDHIRIDEHRRPAPRHETPMLEETWLRPPPPDRAQCGYRPGRLCW